MFRRRVRIQTQDFNLNDELALLRGEDAAVGAIASFVGTVRDRNVPTVADIAALELEHYPGGTEAAIDRMIDAAASKFDICGATVIHRVGKLSVLDQIVLVAVTSPHRGHGFQACEFLMDYLKTQAPFWKREHRRLPDGSLRSEWVDARVSDDEALARWGVVVNNAETVG